MVAPSERRAPGAIGDCAFSPDNALIAATTPVGVRVWRVTTGEDVATLAGGAAHDHAVAFSPDGKLLASGGAGLAIWELDTHEPLASFPAERAGEINALQFSHDGLLLASCGGSRGQITLWDVAARARSSVGRQVAMRISSCRLLPMAAC